MHIDSFTVVTGLLLGSFLALALHFLGRRDIFLRTFGVRTMLFLYLLCVLRTALPVKFPFAIPIGTSACNRLAAVLNIPLFNTRWNMGQLLMAVWLTGTTVSLLRFAVREIRLARRLREYPGTRNHLAETVLEHILQTSPRQLPVQVRVYQRLNMPVGVGIIHPLICLPDRDYTAKELGYILRHEYAHFLGRDLYVKFLARVYAGLFWWNPAAWLLLEDIGQMLELRCDRMVTKNVAYFGPMTGTYVSFQIPNGTIAEFDRKLHEMVPEADMLDIAYSDNGYEQVMPTLERTRSAALLLCAVGAASAVAVIVLLLYFFITRERRRTAIERGLGMTKHQCRVSLIAGILVLALVGTILGSALGTVMVSTVDLNSNADQESSYSVYRTKFSDWTNKWNQVIEVQDVQPVPLEALAMGIPLVLLVFIAVLSLVMVGFNLRVEPIMILGGKEDG